MNLKSVFVLDFVYLFFFVGEVSHRQGDIRAGAVGDESRRRIYLSNPVGRWASKAAITPGRDHRLADN